MNQLKNLLNIHIHVDVIYDDSLAQYTYARNVRNQHMRKILDAMNSFINAHSDFNELVKSFYDQFITCCYYWSVSKWSEDDVYESLQEIICKYIRHCEPTDDVYFYLLASEMIIDTIIECKYPIRNVNFIRQLLYGRDLKGIDDNTKLYIKTKVINYEHFQITKQLLDEVYSFHPDYKDLILNRFDYNSSETYELINKCLVGRHCRYDHFTREFQPTINSLLSSKLDKATKLKYAIRFLSQSTVEQLLYNGIQNQLSEWIDELLQNINKLVHKSPNNNPPYIYRHAFFVMRVICNYGYQLTQSQVNWMSHHIGVFGIDDIYEWANFVTSCGGELHSKSKLLYYVCIGRNYHDDNTLKSTSNLIREMIIQNDLIITEDHFIDVCKNAHSSRIFRQLSKFIEITPELIKKTNNSLNNSVSISRISRNKNKLGVITVRN